VTAGGGAKYVESTTHYEINGMDSFGSLNNASLIGIDTNEEIS
jgi:hypothetical protein